MVKKKKEDDVFIEEGDFEGGLPPNEYAGTFGDKNADQSYKGGKRTSESIIKEIAERNFNSPDLVLKTHSEIDKIHLKDHSIKLTTFGICCTAYLEPMNLHKSIAQKGNSSVGKDNLNGAILSFFPDDDYILLTFATRSVLEDDIKKFKIIWYSEINLGREDGANAHLRESVKQLAEGGISSLKKDQRTGFKTTLHSKQEQKTVLYGTTETDTDDELVTRFILGSVEASKSKIEAVNINTLNWFAGDRPKQKNMNWIKCGIINFLKSKEVVLPYCKDLPKEFFDNTDPRSMRDVKRILALASGWAWYYQKQRKTDEEGRIISEPMDLLIAMITSKDFFNLTYSGLGDMRLQRCMESINQICDKNGSDIFLRKDLQDKMGITRNTVKSYLKGLSRVSIAVFSHKDGNDIYYKRYQKGVNKRLIGVNWKELIQIFHKTKVSKITKSTVNMLEKLESICKSDELESISEKIDTLKLTPLIEVEELLEPYMGKCVVCGKNPCHFNTHGKYFCSEDCVTQYRINKNEPNPNHRKTV